MTSGEMLPKRIAKRLSADPSWDCGFCDLGGLEDMAKDPRAGRRNLQLNFTSHFQTDDPTPIDYLSRPMPNLYHDIFYLSSYIHDSRFKMRNIAFRGKKLIVPLERDRWELFGKRKNLQSIPSRLIIYPVLSMCWEFCGPLAIFRGDLRSRDVWIRHFYLGESFWDDSDRWELVLSCPGFFKLRISVPEFDFTVRLVDATRKK